jgi:putative DNA primase/helicase
VQTARNAYAETEDHTGRFIGECCTLGPARRAEQARLYDAYEDWCRSEDAVPLSSRTFATRVREAVGIASSQELIRSNQRRFYPGIALMAEVGADE